jgi:hypothetical protein
VTPAGDVITLRFVDVVVLATFAVLVDTIVVGPEVAADEPLEGIAVCVAPGEI